MARHGVSQMVRAKHARFAAATPAAVPFSHNQFLVQRCSRLRRRHPGSPRADRTRQRLRLRRLFLGQGPGRSYDSSLPDSGLVVLELLRHDAGRPRTEIPAEGVPFQQREKKWGDGMTLSSPHEAVALISRVIRAKFRQGGRAGQWGKTPRARLEHLMNNYCTRRR